MPKYNHIHMLYFFLHIHIFTSASDNKINNKITEENINIKPLTAVEKNFYVKISNDPRIKYQSLSIKQEQINERNMFQYKLRETNPLLKINGVFVDNKCIGYIGFYNDNTRPHTLFIYYAVDPTYWGKGICSLAVKNFIKNMKETAKSQGFNLIKATVKIDNIGSQKVLEKNNFKALLKKNGSKLVKLIDNQSTAYEYDLNLS